MKLIINGNIINYLDLGNREGKILVFLHGWLDSLNSFKKVSELLKKDYRIILLDLPGFGESTLENKKADVSYYVNFIKNFIEKLNIIPYAYVGHSFGGRILLKGLGMNILNSEKLILVGSAGIIENKNFKNISLIFLSKCFKFILNLPIIKNYKEKIRNRFYKNIGSDYLNSTHLQEVYKNILKEDLQIYAKNIKTKTLLIYGENDFSTPIKYGQIFNKLIISSELVIIKNSTHFVHQEKPEETALYIDKFLQK
jgi:pimeloyl-ACP methyl ester carboxylesterase